MISEDCGVHRGVGGRISYQSAEALTYTYCWAGLKVEAAVFCCMYNIVIGSYSVLAIKCEVYWKCTKVGIRKQLRYWINFS